MASVGSSRIVIRDIPFAALDFESAGERANEAGVPVQIGIAGMHGQSFAAKHLVSESASFYRKMIQRHGFLPVGSHCYLGPAMSDRAMEMERGA